MTDLQNLPNIVESILFGAGRPMRLSEMKTLMGSQNIEVDLPSIKVALNSLEEKYADSSIEIKEVASGFRMQVRESYGDFLYPLWNDTSSRLSKALMETVSIIAYKQPVTRGDIEDIRGVTVVVILSLGTVSISCPPEIFSPNLLCRCATISPRLLISANSSPGTLGNAGILS